MALLQHPATFNGLPDFQHRHEKENNGTASVRLLDPFNYFSVARALAGMPFLITRVVPHTRLKSQSSAWKWERRLPNVTGSN